MKNKIIIFILCLVVNISVAQDSLQLSVDFDKYPEFVEEVNWGAQLKAQFDKRDSIYKSVNTDLTGTKLTAEELKLLDRLGEIYQDQWDVVGGGCSWYCGAGDFVISSSSELISKNDSITYAGKNAHDLNYKTAWVEGVPGHGIGEFLLYTFPARHPRITKIIIANGYVKSEESFRNNSRVKTLAVYKDDVKIAILHLQDIRGNQGFSFYPIGNSRTEIYDIDNQSVEIEIDIESGDWSLKFEILEVYKGDKYEDTVISEIYFDGLDVH